MTTKYWGENSPLFVEGFDEPVTLNHFYKSDSPELILFNQLLDGKRIFTRDDMTILRNMDQKLDLPIVQAIDQTRPISYRIEVCLKYDFNDILAEFRIPDDICDIAIEYENLKCLVHMLNKSYRPSTKGLEIAYTSGSLELLSLLYDYECFEWSDQITDIFCKHKRYDCLDYVETCDYKINWVRSWKSIVKNDDVKLFKRSRIPPNTDIVAYALKKNSCNILEYILQHNVDFYIADHVWSNISSHRALVIAQTYRSILDSEWLAQHFVEKYVQQENIQGIMYLNNFLITRRYLSPSYHIIARKMKDIYYRNDTKDNPDLLKILYARFSFKILSEHVIASIDRQDYEFFTYVISRYSSMFVEDYKKEYEMIKKIFNHGEDRYTEYLLQNYPQPISYWVCQEIYAKLPLHSRKSQLLRAYMDRHVSCCVIN